MAYTASFSVNVGDPTKASDVTTLAANDDFLKAAVDAIMADSATPTSALKNGVTATTQSASDNSTKVATTAYVDASSTDPGGSNTQIQYNNSGAFGASANLTFDGSTLAVTGALSATGNVSFDGGSFVFNESGADKDFRIEGDSDQNLFVADASTDRIGIGTAAPATQLHVDGSTSSEIRIGNGDADNNVAGLSLWAGTTPAERLSIGVNWGGGYVGYDSWNAHYFQVGGSTKLTVEPDGDVKVSDGDLIIGTSGHGIDFSANSHAGGMTSELLDSYEEGTWTAVFKYGGTGGTAYSVNNNVCAYTKIGNIVHFTCETEITNPSASNSSSTTVILTGLPFTSFASVNRAPSPNVRINLFTLANCAGVNGFVGNNDTYCALYKQMNNGSWTGDVKSSEIYQSSGSVWINVTGWYYTD